MHRSSRRRLLAGLTGAGGLACGLGFLGPAIGAPKIDMTPIATGPVSGGDRGRMFGASTIELDLFDYVEEEFFFSGEATRYEQIGELKIDGKWTVHAVDPARYTMRLIVRRPRTGTKFNGTAIVEWLNVSEGYENTLILDEGIYRSGFAYVGVSAQQVGVTGFKNHPRGLKAWDRKRYEALVMPGEAYSYDIFTQGGRAVGPGRRREGADPMGGLAVRKLIATGASQSAAKLVTYANAIQRLAKVFDAIVPIVGFGTGGGLGDAIYDPSQGSDGASLMRLRGQFRDDLSTPVLMLNSESEALAYFGVRQQDSPRFRYWEVAGAAHGPPSARARMRVMLERDELGTMKPSDHVPGEVDWGPVADAAFVHVNRWIRGGPPPPAQPPIQIEAGPPAAIVRDENGNAVGGIRLPELAVPIASYAAGPDARTAALSGITKPFEAAQLAQLYPTHEVYVAKVAKAASAAVAAGIIPAWRRDQYVAAARAHSL